MHCRDGTRLDAHVYRPADAGDFPVLLMRQPYGRSIASTVTYAHPSWYARQGYLVVIQDVRGRGISEGAFRLLADEVADGEDTVAWAAALPGSSGALGMYGFSYQAMTQYFAAAGGHPALRTLAPAMGAWDLHHDMAYEGGSIRLQTGIGWAIQLAVEGARRAGDAAAHRALYAASRALPLHEAVPSWPAVLREHERYAHWGDWLRHPDPEDAYWAERSPRHVAAGIDLPILHIGGWFDPMLTGTLAAYRHFAARGKAPQKLMIGPWAHIPWGRRAGQMDFGPAAARSMDRLQLRWFDHWLKGLDTGLLDEPPVELFEIGRNAWRGFDRWPAATEACFLHSDGLAAMDPASGGLAATERQASGEDVLVLDPWRPFPTTGGHLTHPAGPADRAAVEQRSDCLTFTTPPLMTELSLAGDVVAELFAEADHPSFDLACVLSMVQPDGKVLPLTEGYARIDTPGQKPIRITLRAVAVWLPVGGALRLTVQPCSFPAHPVNPGTGQQAWETRLIDQRIVTVTLRHGGDTPSRLLLPVL